MTNARPSSRDLPTSRRAVLLAFSAVASAVVVRPVDAAGPNDVDVGGRPATRPVLAPTDASVVRARADEVVARAVRSPLGWGWAEDQTGVDLSRVRDPRLRSRPIDAVRTARAGLLLDLAAGTTGSAAYRSAAVEAARALSALQTRAGQIRGRGVMGMVVGVREDDAGDPPERLATTAAVATMAHLLDRPEPFDARLRGPLQRAAHWLASQQTRMGGWPGAYPPVDPSVVRGVGPRLATQKLLRLDVPDFRDASLAVLLTANLLDDRQLLTYVDRTITQLASLRLVAGAPPKRAMWAAAYRPDGDPNPRLPEFPYCVDLLATRHAAEVLLADALLRPAAGPPVAGPSAAATPLAELRTALASLPRTAAGGWHRRYVPDTLTPLVAPTTAPTTQPASYFDVKPATQPAVSPVSSLAPPRTADLLARLDRLRDVGIAALNQEMAAGMPVRRRMAVALAGLADDAMVVDAIRPPAVGDRPPGGNLDDALDGLWRALAGG